MKELLLKMFNGWKIREESWDPATQKYGKCEEEAMIEACGGDYAEGCLLSLFDHWSNDIMLIAPNYGVSYEHDEHGVITIRDDVPPPPEPLSEHKQYHWEDGVWKDLGEDIQVCEAKL